MDQAFIEQKAKKIINKIQSKEIYLKDLVDEELHAIFAYEMWKKGMEWKDVEKIKSNPFWTRWKTIDYLKGSFGY